MYNIYDNRRENTTCQCPCHLHCTCINEEYHNKSDLLPDINVQNPNSEYISYSYNNITPTYIKNQIYDYTYSPNWSNNCSIKSIKLKERAQSLKDKINSKYFIQSINQRKKKNIWDDSFNNNFNNLYTFKGNKNYLNQSKSYLKSKIKNINEENKHLNELLSKVPRHEKSPYSPKAYINKLKHSFPSVKYIKRQNDMKSILKNKKYEGYSSMIMPPNDLEALTIKNCN